MLSQVDSENWSKAALQKSVLKICDKFTGEYQSRIVISINLESNFIEIALRLGYFPVNLPEHLFQNIFSQEHQWRATSDWSTLVTSNIINQFRANVLLG